MFTQAVYNDCVNVISLSSRSELNKLYTSSLSYIIATGDSCKPKTDIKTPFGNSKNILSSLRTLTRYP